MKERTRERTQREEGIKSTRKTELDRGRQAERRRRTGVTENGDRSKEGAKKKCRGGRGEKRKNEVGTENKA